MCIALIIMRKLRLSFENMTIGVCRMDRYRIDWCRERGVLGFLEQDLHKSLIDGGDTLERHVYRKTISKSY